MAKENLKTAIMKHPVIDKQLEAYRRRDVSAFAAFYSPEIKAYRNGVLFISGLEQLISTYKELFDLSPGLAIEISNRSIEGGFVRDTELITGLRGNPKQVTAHVRYKVEETKIVEVMITFAD